MPSKAPFKLFPQPRRCKFTDEKLSLQKPFSLCVSGDEKWVKSESRKAITLIKKAAGKRLFMDEKGGDSEIVIAGMDSIPDDKLKPVRKPEGYILRIDSEGILLAGADARGLFYGTKALEQVISNSDGEIPGVEIRDWPEKPMRGVHLFLPARKQLQFMLDFIDFLGRHRYNTLFLELGAAMKFKSHPELNKAWSKFAKFAMQYTSDQDPDPSTCDPDRWEPKKFPKGPYALMCSRRGYLKDSIHPDNGMGDVLTQDEVAKIIKACRKNHIEIIPEVQALSHTYWMCIAHPNIAERAEDPWPDTYCPSNPKTYEILFDVMGEVIDLFKPRIIHIGHDELWSIGLCPKCRDKKVEDLFAMDVNKIHDFLKSRGVRTALWGDKLMSTAVLGDRKQRKRNDSIDEFTVPDTWKAVNKIPQDVLVTDWYWSLNPESVAHFGKRNIRVAFGNFSPYGMAEWNERAKASNVVGAEISTWCEVSPEAYGHNNVLDQMLAGANILWSGKYRTPNQLREQVSRRAALEAERVFGLKRRMIRGPETAARPIDISSALSELPDSLNGAISTGASGEPAVGNAQFKFHIDGRGALNRAIILDQSNRKSAPVPVDAIAKSLVILNASTLDDVFYMRTYHNWFRNPAEIVRYRIKYKDGKSVTVRAIYPDDIGDLFNKGSAANSWRAIGMPAGKDSQLYALEWANPRPNAKIESVTALLGPDATDKGEIVIPAISIF